MALRKRVRRAHSKAKAAGTFYLLGALALAVLAFLPALNIAGKDLWMLTFYSPIISLFSGTFDLMGVIVAVLYLWMVLACLVNFFKCCSKFRWLTKRSWRYVNGYNRNIRAMEDIGKRFSGSFAAIVNVSFLISILQSNTSDVRVTMYAYITLAVGCIIHFIAGLIAGKVSCFDVHGNGGNVEEIKREIGISVYFFRNLVQIAAVAAILYFFVPVCTIGAMMADLLGGANPLGGNLITTIVPVALQALITICMFVLIKHATGTTEFNRSGMEGKGMKNYRVFSFFVFLLAVGVFAVDYLLVQPDPITYNFVCVAAIAFVVFLVDCIFKTRVKEELEEEYPAVDEAGKDKMAQPVPPCSTAACPRPVCPGQTAPMQAPYPQMSPQITYQQQPVYIPVYYPYPIQQPMPMPAPAHAPVEVNIMSPSAPVPTPAPVEVKFVNSPASVDGKLAVSATATPVEKLIKPAPAPAPASAVAPAPAPASIKPQPSPFEKAKQESLDNEDDELVELSGLDPKKDFKVRCPRCGKFLAVRDVSPYHRCPVCDKVFSLKKFQTYKRKD